MHLLIPIHLIVDSRLKPENISGIFIMLPLCCIVCSNAKFEPHGMFDSAGLYAMVGG